MRRAIAAIALALATAAPSWACSPRDWRPGDFVFDAVALGTRPLPSTETEFDTHLGWAQRRYDRPLEIQPDAATRFRVVEYFRGGGDDVIEIEHINSEGPLWFADCVGQPFVRGERVFIHAYLDRHGTLYTYSMANARGDERQRHLDWARSPRFWLEGSSPYDEVPEPPERPEDGGNQD